MHTFPNEVKQTVLSFLNTHALTSMRLVSKEWPQLVDNTIKTRITRFQELNKINFTEICKSVKETFDDQELDRKSKAIAVRQHFAKVNTLVIECVAILYYYAPGKDPNSLFPIISNNPRFPITDRLPITNYLKCLEFYTNDNLNDEELKQLQFIVEDFWKPKLTIDTIHSTLPTILSDGDTIKKILGKTKNYMLYIAIKKNCVPFMDHLLTCCMKEHNSSLNVMLYYRRRYQFHPFILAVQRRHITIIKKMVEKDPLIVSAKTKDWNSPILAANSYDVLKVLVYLGANINAVNEDGHTPLYLAGERLDVDSVLFLYKKQCMQKASSVLVSNIMAGANESIFNYLDELDTVSWDSSCEDSEGLSRTAAMDNYIDIIKKLEGEGVSFDNYFDDHEITQYFPNDFEAQIKEALNHARFKKR